MAADPLAPIREAPGRSALILDVDGTLAPIVDRPDLAAVPASTQTQLAKLARRYLLVACLSGRPGADAERLVGVEGIRYVGNHGLELDPRARDLARSVAAFRDSVGREVEDKGLTLSYHFREAADESRARKELEAVAQRARDEGLLARWGRKVLEIRPPIDADKGTAVEVLIRESGATRALYAGDDTTDLDAFAGLGVAELHYFVRIAVASDEASTDLLEAADVVVDGPVALARLLAHL